KKTLSCRRGLGLRVCSATETAARRRRRTDQMKIDDGVKTAVRDGAMEIDDVLHGHDGRLATEL
ncbi:hypothetical protein HN51_042800, partial [Arachis hypogaea]